MSKYISTRYCLLCLLLIVSLLCGCADNVPKYTSEVLSPEYESISYSSNKVKLYYRFNEDLLAGETRIIDSPNNERMEMAVLNELINGPSSVRSDLGRLINADTKVLSIDESEGVLIVTFSSEFLSFPNDQPQDWAVDIIQQNEANKRKKLALYSVVNSIVGIGKYGKVQVLIDIDGTGSGKRLDAAEFGFASDNGASTLIEPLGYNENIVLTPSTAADSILRGIMKRDWEEVYSFLAKKGSNNIDKPVFNIARQSMEDYEQLISYDIKQTILDSDGLGAVVIIDFVLNTNQERLIEINDIPIRLIIENEAWKLGFDILNDIFRNKDQS